MNTVEPDQLLTYFIAITIWATLATVIIILARRDVGLGLKKWLLTRLGKQPIIIRYHGPNRHVTEHVVSTKGIGEVIELRGRRFFFFKAKDGEKFFIDPASAIRRDDNVNELTYNHASTMPIDPTKRVQDILKKKDEWLVDVQKFLEENSKEGMEPVDVDQLTTYTNPKLLDKYGEYVYLAAKADALRDATSLEKWVKFGVLAGAASAIIGLLLWYNLDGKVIPMLQSIAGQVSAIASSLNTAVTATVTA